MESISGWQSWQLSLSTKSSLHNCSSFSDVCSPALFPALFSRFLGIRCRKSSTSSSVSGDSGESINDRFSYYADLNSLHFKQRKAWKPLKLSKRCGVTWGHREGRFCGLSGGRPVLCRGGRDCWTRMSDSEKHRAGPHGRKSRCPEGLGEAVPPSRRRRSRGPTSDTRARRRGFPGPPATVSSRSPHTTVTT